AAEGSSASCAGPHFYLAVTQQCGTDAHTCAVQRLRGHLEAHVPVHDPQFARAAIFQETVRLSDGECVGSAQAGQRLADLMVVIAGYIENLARTKVRGRLCTRASYGA